MHALIAPRCFWPKHKNATPENWPCALPPGSFKVTENGASDCRAQQSKGTAVPGPEKGPSSPCVCGSAHMSAGAQDDRTGRKQTWGRVRGLVKGKMDFMINGPVEIILSLG